MLKSLVKRVAVLCVAVAHASCGGSAPAPAKSLDLSIGGRAVTKVQAGAQGIVVLEEKLTSLQETGPDRRLSMLDDAGALTGVYSAPTDWALIDFARHPSGEITVVLATEKTVRLVRLDRFSAPIADSMLVDAEAASDPFYDSGGVHDDASLLPWYTRDAVRLAAIGEDVAVALHTGRNAAVAYRFAFGRAAGFTRVWRTLVEPGLSMFGVGLTSGTFDTFDQLKNMWQIHLDADARGNVAVAVVGLPFRAEVFAAHADYFGESTAVATGLLVTRLAPDGRRAGTTFIDTTATSELHGLRLSGDEIALVGRVFSEKRADGTGWNAYAARVDRTGGALVGYRTIDVDRGDVLFDIAPLRGGRYLVAGAAGYTQNPSGGSISETTTPLLAVLEPDGTVKQRIAIAAGPRQNQLRSLAARGAAWLIGGMADGPGTHSGDGDRTLIEADGLVRELAVPVSW